MPTSFTERLLIVVRAAIRDQANAVAQVADPSTGPDTFRAGLKFTTNPANTADVYWSGWTMTPEQRERLIAEFGRRAGNLQVYAKGANVPMNRDYWLFEANEETGWAPHEVMAALGLTYLSNLG